MEDNPGNNKGEADRGNRSPGSRLGIALAILLWTICITASLAWNFRDKREQIQGLALVEARAIMMKDLEYRRWVSDRGGVYIPFGGETPPNPSLSHIPERDVVTSSGIRLMLVNPEYMMRQVYDLAGGPRGHVTSLDPILPENGADPWESRALKTFQHGEKEVSSVDLLDGKPFMRLMRPLVAEERCIKCHWRQGYKVGDIRGGISVSVPMEPFEAVADENIRGMFLGHGGIWLAGMALLGAGSSVFRRQERQRERVRSVLDAERDRIEAIFAVTPDQIVQKDLRSVYRMANPAFCRFVGMSEQEIIGKTDHDLFPPEEADRYRADDAKVMANGELQIQDELSTSREGRRWVQVGKIPIRDASGAVTGVLCSVRDIHERKAMEEKLKESEVRYRSLVEISPDAIYLLDMNAKILFCNTKASRLAGYADERELRGKNAIEFLVPGDRERAIMDIRTVLREGSLQDIEYTLVSSGGEHVPIEASACALADHEGKPAAVNVIVRDNSRRKQAEEIARRETALRSVLLDNLPCIALVIRKGTREIVACNEIARKLGAVVGKTCFDSLAVPGSPCPFCRAPELWETGERKQIEVEYLDRFWQGIWVPFSDDYYVHYVFEITDRKRAEEEKIKLEAQLQQAVKMEAVGRLAGGVAHDFNNLLTAIMGNISLAQMRLPPSDVASVRLAEAGKAAERAAGLTQKLLAFSRKQIIEPKVLDLNELISDLHSMLVRLIGEDIEIRYVPGDGLGMVKVDAGQLEQVLVNLVVNARDAMPGGGKIVMETSNAVLDDDYRSRHPYVKSGERFVMLAVSDTGHGMSDQVKAHLFEPFFTTKPTGAGTGLGLAMVYGAVKQAGGSIEVYSELGMGTTFKIYLPKTGEKLGASDAKGEQAAPSGGCETILVVEDEDLVRGLWVEALERLGYKVMHASNGEEAVESAKAHAERIDLLLTDIVLPGINGRELADNLLRIHPEMKVLFTSGYTENAIVHQGVLDEGVDFIGKPYSPSVLAKKIREVLERE